MRRKRIVVLGLVVAVVLGVAWWRRQRDAPPDGALVISGTIETTEVELSFKVAGRVAERLVDEGAAVTAGQVVARLETSDLAAEAAQRRAEVAQATARLAELRHGARPEELAQAAAAAAQARAVLAELAAGTRAEVVARLVAAQEQAAQRLAELVAGTRPEEVAQAAAALAQATAEVQRTLPEVTRARELATAQVLAPEELERREAAHAAALARQAAAQAAYELAKAGPRAEAIAQARAALAQATAQAEEAKRGPRPETIAQAQAALAQAEAAEALVKAGPRQEVIAQAEAALARAEAAASAAATRLAEAELRSPLAGTVLSKACEPGEFVNAGTAVVTVGALDEVWLRGYVPLTALARVKQGQEVAIQSEAGLSAPLTGRVSFIASEAEFTPKTIQTPTERVKLVYRVKITIPNAAHELKPGMPADAILSAAP